MSWTICAPCKRVTLQGLFVAAVVAIYVTVYRPIIRKMDVTIKRSRSMLLLFPGDVVHSVAPIRDTMAAYAKSVSGGGAAWGHGG